MRPTLFGALALLLATPALAEDLGRVAVSVGYAGMAGPPAATGERVSAGASGAAYLSFRVLDRLALDVGGREGVASGDLRVLGAVQVAARYSVSDLVYLRGGFVHHHETPWDAFQEDPVMAALGSSDGIRHRSGVDGGLGLRFALPSASAPVSTSLEVSAMFFPDTDGPRVYGVLQQLFTIDLGRRPSDTPI